MPFNDGKMYTVSVVSKGNRYWNEVQKSVDEKINHRLKGQIGKYVIAELYDVKWRTKPFPFSYFKEFKPNRRFFFHGTSSQVIQKILDEGFKVTSVQAKHGRMLGNGVYLAYHTNKGKSYASDDYVLSVMVYAPNTLVVGPEESITEDQINKAATKYDAIEVRTGAIVKYSNQQPWTMQNHEICVFDTYRVIPRFILKLTHTQK